MSQKSLSLIYLITKRLQDMGQIADKLKVYKLMYFVDFEFYLKQKKSISGGQYYNCQFGPVPATNQQNYFKDNLIDKGVSKKLWTLRNDNEILTNVDKMKELESFHVDEIETIDQILDVYGKLKSMDLVTLTHQDVPWKMTKNGEVIEYDYVFWRETEEVQIKNITEQVLQA